MRTAGVLLFLWAALPSLLAQQQCPVGAGPPEATQVAAIQRALLNERVEEMSTDISIAAQEKIHKFKDTLVDLANAVMSCTPTESTSSVIQNTISSLLVKYPSNSTQTTDEVYGTDLEAIVSTPNTFPGLRVIQFRFATACGYDSLLLFYEAHLQHWQLKLRWQRNSYDKESGAFGDFVEYAMLPQASSNKWRVVVSHGHPWCTSRWSGFEIDLLEPGPVPSSPHVIWHEEDGYAREDAPKLRATSDGFDLRLDVGTIESDVMVRKGVFRYRVSGNSLERVQPIATNGRSFIDAWLQAPWSDAQRWTAPSALADAREAHEDFSRERAKKSWNVSYTYGPVHNCGMQRRAQVEIDRQPGDPTFYIVTSGNNSFTLESVSQKPDGRCSGPDIMKTP